MNPATVTLAEEIIAALVAAEPAVVAAVDAWIHGAGSEKLAVAAARAAGDAAVDAYQAAKDKP